MLSKLLNINFHAKIIEQINYIERTLYILKLVIGSLITRSLYYKNCLIRFSLPSKLCKWDKA